MSGNYYRVKKHRELKSQVLIVDNDRNEEKTENNKLINSEANHDVSTLITLNETPNQIVNFDLIAANNGEEDNFSDNNNIYDDVTHNIDDDDKQVGLVNDELNRLNIEQKIRDWALNNLNTLRLNVITDLLLLLRTEGYSSLPKTSQTLLGTQHHRVLRLMESKLETAGEYVYLGILNGLKKIIQPMEYDDDEINVLIHIDGMQVFKSSQVQIWPISVKIYHSNYDSQPFVAAIFCGDSKPRSVREYLQDFIDEANMLTSKGIQLQGKTFSFRILAIIADSPARSYIKCCKSPGAFYACERCITKGLSIGEKKKKKRVYPEMNSAARTSTSFRERHHSGHHLDCVSPLITLNNFDPVKSVVLDSMHLLFLGVMKFLLESWVNRSSGARLKLSQVKILSSILNSIKPGIPDEFQRKQYLIKNISRWKATQFRFFLLYVGPIVMQKLLPNNYYQHFLLLSVACRILHSKELMIEHNEYAKNLLRKFFYLLPSLYGKNTQVLSMHNLIHLSDDVLNLKLPLSDISAFWGESFIGKFSSFVKSSRKPLTQIVNRLSELDSSNKNKMKKNIRIDRCSVDENCLFIYRGQEYYEISSISINNSIIKLTKPNNCLQLIDGKIIMVYKILLKRYSNMTTIYEKDIFILCSELNDTYQVFNYPTASTDIGIIAGNHFAEQLQLVSIKNVKVKCVLLNINCINIAITLLHN